MTFPAVIRDKINNVAAERRELHANHASSNPLSENHEEVGLAGEFAFGIFCGQMPDLERRAKGDGGIDFHLPVIFTVDVKTSRKGNYLLHETGKGFADIYVLAKYDKETGEVSLVGWTWGTTLKSVRPKDTGRGVINHYLSRNKLRPMRELKRMAACIRRQE